MSEPFFVFCIGQFFMVILIVGNVVFSKYQRSILVYHSYWFWEVRIILHLLMDALPSVVPPYCQISYSK